ncbi:uncharacterized protein [Triticum aestivum]|uniref:uncharacterized protein n=1 Tax=Triticum aestivum TaxID=4565 RepID=UPI001D026792|nr:uncharacterized protein LOC123149874 [Triticum aestivum]
MAAASGTEEMRALMKQRRAKRMLSKTSPRRLALPCQARDAAVACMHVMSTRWPGACYFAYWIAVSHERAPVEETWEHIDAILPLLRPVAPGLASPQLRLAAPRLAGTCGTHAAATALLSGDEPQAAPVHGRRAHNLEHGRGRDQAAGGCVGRGELPGGGGARAAGAASCRWELAGDAADLAGEATEASSRARGRPRWRGSSPVFD